MMSFLARPLAGPLCQVVDRWLAPSYTDNDDVVYCG